MPGGPRSRRSGRGAADPDAGIRPTAARGTQQVTDDIAGVSRAAGETGEAAGQVLDAARELSQQAEQMRGEVDRFLREVRAG